MKLKPEFQKLSRENRLHGLDIPVIGLTGGIASGKSTVSRLLKNRGMTVLDADQMIKEIYALSETKQFIQQICPEAIQHQEVNFPELRKRFFQDQKLKQQIESFLYLRLPETFRDNLKRAGDPSFVVYDVPLLFEKNLQDKVDIRVLVYAPRKIQLARLMKRDNQLEDMALKILDQQMDIEDKKAKSDLVIDNSQTEAELLAEVELFVSRAFI